MIKLATMRYFVLIDIKDATDSGTRYHSKHNKIPELESAGLIRWVDDEKGGWIITDAGRSNLPKIGGENG
ncbi:hypothetical protein G6L15_08300 [Agrobacterium rhizogenes]|uniref:hypothetical protein n=1 Tax=Rhizobium rhizogenes TaxID=359 RepID=UPI001573D807|nr:hypothetical protein [Rhizobium rhizogenes]NTG86145.1 hypothetical protein [Rhizobium rhizogenes]